MKINIYYGGRGLIEDPSLYVMNKITEVFEDLRVQVARYNLFEQKNSITVLSNTLKEADGVVLTVNVEWLGIGGYMQQFLDSCWLYADKEKIKTLYMMPVVVTNSYGERDAQKTLATAWEILGGTTTEGICAFVESQVDFETNLAYRDIIEKRAEDFYRIINQKGKVLPSSSYAVNKSIPVSQPIDLTPQESEQLSLYVSDEIKVQKQKKDIEELAELFKGMLSSSTEEKYEFEKNLRDNFHPQGKEFKAVYSISFSDTNKTLVIEVAGDTLHCYYGNKKESEVDVAAKTTRAVMEKIIRGRITFQGAFMSGELSCKGDFKSLRTFDKIFIFNTLS